MYYQESKNQLCNQTRFTEFSFLLPSNEVIIFISTNCSLVKITSYCLNPNLVLKLCAATVLQSMIILIVNS